MRILVTNDDGVMAQGILALAAVLVELGHDVTVIAPSDNQSGKAQAISIHNPIRARRVPYMSGVSEAFSVDGTPADCIRVTPGLMGGRPELVMSGINHGANLGTDVHRSGTVGAAREAVLMGLPAVALSALSEVPSPSALRYHIPEVAYLALASPGHLINVNFPVVPNLIRVIVPAASGAYWDESQVREASDGTLEVRVRRTLMPDTTLNDVRAALMGYVTVSRIPVTGEAPRSGELPLFPEVRQQNA